MEISIISWSHNSTLGNFSYFWSLIEALWYQSWSQISQTLQSSSSVSSLLICIIFFWNLQRIQGYHLFSPNLSKSTGLPMSNTSWKQIWADSVLVQRLTEGSKYEKQDWSAQSLVLLTDCRYLLTHFLKYNIKIQYLLSKVYDSDIVLSIINMICPCHWFELLLIQISFQELLPAWDFYLLIVSCW